MGKPDRSKSPLKDLSFLRTKEEPFAQNASGISNKIILPSLKGKQFDTVASQYSQSNTSTVAASSGVASMCAPAPPPHPPRREGSPLFLDDGQLSTHPGTSGGIKRSTFTNFADCLKGQSAAPPKHSVKRRLVTDDLLTRSVQKNQPFPETEDSTELGC